MKEKEKYNLNFDAMNASAYNYKGLMNFLKFVSYYADNDNKNFDDYENGYYNGVKETYKLLLRYNKKEKNE